MPCPNAAPREAVKGRFEDAFRREYVGQQQAALFVRSMLESYTGLAPRSTCLDWVLHLTGPSGSGKSFLAQLVAEAAFEPWEEESYPRAQLGLASTSCALLATLGAALGPVGATVGCAAGAVGAYATVDMAASRTFRAPRHFPRQCGVRQHKFARHSGIREVEQWEYAVAQQLLRDPAAVIIVDDVGRLQDAAAFEHLGRLLCGVGGNSIPEFRTGPDAAELVPASRALFILTSDLEMDESAREMGCEVGSFEQMLNGVRAQSERYWAERQLVAPDWWQALPIVPFRELCADELSQVVRKYAQRQCDEASQHVHADMDRRRDWTLGAAQVHRWIGTVQHGQGSLNILDAYVTETASRNQLIGGRQGAWIVNDFHLNIMRPAMQELTSRDERNATIISEGGHRREVSFWNTSTLTYTTELCLEVYSNPAGGMPLVRFVRMRGVCP